MRRSVRVLCLPVVTKRLSCDISQRFNTERVYRRTPIEAVESFCLVCMENAIGEGLELVAAYRQVSCRRGRMDVDVRLQPRLNGVERVLRAVSHIGNNADGVHARRQRSRADCWSLQLPRFGISWSIALPAHCAARLSTRR